MPLLLVSLTACAPKVEKDKDREKEWRYLYDLGMSAYFAKNYSEAIAHFYRATRVAPDEPKIWNALGTTYMAVEEYRKAEEAFLRAVQVDPGFSEARMNLGILYFRMEDYKRAVENLKIAIADEVFDKKHIAFYHLAKVYKELGDTGSYIEFLRKATAYNPLFIEAQLELGSAYMDAKDYEKAESLYQSLLSNNIKNPEIYLSLAKVYYETGRFDRAKEMVRMVLEDRQTNNLQRSQAYGILSKILIEEQRRTIELMERERKRKEEEGRYGIQVAAFSTRKGAEKLVKRLKRRGLERLSIVEVSGIYKVIYGRFRSREEAKRELERLKDMEIYGFIVEVE
ncbi:MAG: tetratricopeptide repeat protein [Aquificota bacterium]|nr:tetratricopeptide repeat protein [Aquificota bacterium]